MFWRKFIGREVRSRYNSSRVLELKKVPVKKKEEKRYDENSVDDVIIGGWRVVNLPLAGRVPWRSHVATDKTLRAGNAPMFWRKFTGREVRSRCNSSRVLELKKVPVKKRRRRDMKKIMVVQNSHVPLLLIKILRN
jgi:hypothetical protein